MFSSPTDAPFKAVTSHLSKEEIESYVKNVLEVDVARDEGRADLALLTAICSSYSQHAPYSNIRFLNVPLEDRPAWRRSRVNIDEVRRRGLNRLGGMCFDQNVFLSWILAGLGFQVTYSIAKVFVEEFSHVILFVRLNGADLIIDPNAGVFPLTDNVISLEFVDESPVYASSIWDIKFFKRIVDGEEVIYGAFHWNANTALHGYQAKYVAAEWAVGLEFGRKYLTLEELQAFAREPLDPITTEVLNRPMLYWFPKGRLMHIQNNIVKFEVEGRVRQVEICHNRRQLRQAILDNFQGFFDEETVDKALDAYVAFTGKTDFADDQVPAEPSTNQTTLF